MARILLIEPYADLRSVVSLLLRRSGHDVAAVSDGRGALDALEREFFTCIVVGSPITVDDGGSLVTFLEYVEKWCPEWCSRLVVMTTHVRCGRVAAVAQRLGVCAVFAKPFSPSEFMQVVGDCVAGRQAITRWYGLEAPAAPGPA